MGAVDRPDRKGVSQDGDRGPSAAKQTGLIVTATDRLNAVRRQRRARAGQPSGHASGDDSAHRDGPDRIGPRQLAAVRLLRQRGDQADDQRREHMVHHLARRSAGGIGAPQLPYSGLIHGQPADLHKRRAGLQVPGDPLCGLQRGSPKFRASTLLLRRLRHAQLGPDLAAGAGAGEIRDGTVRRISRVSGRRPGALLVATDDGYKPATSISGRANDGRWQNLAGSELALSGQRTVHRPRTTGQRSLHGRRRMAGHRNLHRWWAVLDLAWLARPAGRLYNVGTRGPRFQRHGRRRSDGSAHLDVVFGWWIQLGGRRPSATTRSGCRSRERAGVAPDPSRWTAARGRFALVSSGLRCHRLVPGRGGAPDFRWRMVGEPPLDRGSALLERSDGRRGGGGGPLKPFAPRPALLCGHFFGDLSGVMVPIWPRSEPT